MEKKVFIALALLILFVLSAGYVLGSKVWISGSDTASKPYNYTKAAGGTGGDVSTASRVRVLGFKIWTNNESDMLKTLNVTVYNVHGFNTSVLETVNVANHDNKISGIVVGYDSDNDGVPDAVVPLTSVGSWQTVGSANYIKFNFAGTAPTLPGSQPSNNNYFILFNLSGTNPVDTAYFNVTLETMDSPLTTTSNSTAGAILNATIGSSNLTIDDSAPVVSIVLGSQTKDSDKNGFLDSLIVNFAENLDDTFLNSTGCFRVNTTTGGEVGDVAVSTGETGNDTILYINWTSNQIQYTNTTPIYNYTQNTSCQLKDLAGNLLASNANFATTDGAPPVFWGCTAHDNNNDGKLNNLNCTMSEGLTAGTYAAPKSATLFSAYVNYGLNNENTGLTFSSVATYANGNVSIKFDNLVIGTGNVSLAYTSAADGLNDTKNNITLTNASVIVTDSAVPSILTFITMDTNRNGYIDNVNITFSENLTEQNNKIINETSIGCFMVQVLQGGSDAIIGNTTGTFGDQYFFLNFSQQQWTNTTPKFNYTNNATCALQDFAGNVMGLVPNTTSTDGAPPAFLSCNAYDNDIDGKLNNLNCTMSENLTSGTIKNSLFTTYVNYGANTENRVLTISSVTTRSIGIDQNNVSISLNDAVYGTGNVSLSYTSASDGLNDTKNNATLTNASIVVTDSASPFIIYKGTLDKNANGWIDAFQINFSEAIGNYTFGTTKNAFNSSHNFSIGWAGSNYTNGAGTVVCGGTEKWCIPSEQITIDSDNNYGGVNDSVIFLNFSETQHNFSSGETANLTFSPNGTSLVEDLVGNDLVANRTAENATDGAAPVFWNAIAMDIDKDGRINFINISLSEKVSGPTMTADAFEINASYGKDGSGNSIVRQLILSGSPTITNTSDKRANITIKLDDAVIGTGAVALRYNYSASNSNTWITDEAGLKAASNISIVVTDNASAVVLYEATKDSNTNGYLDAIEVNFSESVLDSSFTDDADNITIGSIARVSLTFNTDSVANDNVIRLYFNGTTTYNTGNVPNVNFSMNTNNGTSNMTDLSGLNISTNTTNEDSTDSAAPVFWTAYSEDIDKNGAIDHINLSMSETLTANTPAAGKFNARVTYDKDSNGYTTRALSISSVTAISGGNVTLQLSDAVYGTGNVSLGYDPAAPGTGILDLSASQAIANSSIKVTDNASAILLSEQTLDNNINGYLDAVQLNFSEPIGNCTFGTNKCDAAHTNISNNFSITSLTTLSAIDTENNFGGVNDSVIYLNFTGTTHNTGSIPNVNLTSNATTLVQDINGITAAVNNTGDQFPADKASPVIWSKGTLSFNRTGYLDTINITFSELVVDNTSASAGGPANFTIEGISTWLYDTAFPGDSANDAYVYLGFTGTTYFTNGTPMVNFSHGGATAHDNLADSAGNKVARNDTPTAGVTATDTAPPVLLTAVASDGATATNGVDSDDYILMTFSEPIRFLVDKTISNTTLNSTKENDAIFYLNATGGTWLGGWDVDVGKFNNSQNITMNVTFPNANSNLSAPDVYLIFMNLSVRDASGSNPVIQDNKTNVSLTGSFQDVQVPSVSSWWTNDSNANGYIDSIVVTMSETVNNDTGRCGLGWNVSNNVTSQNYSVNTFLSTCDNSTRVNITVTELTVFDTNVTVYVNYTSAIGVIRDTTNNNKLGDANSSALDKARPVLLNATTFDGDEDGYIDAYNLTFSENVTDGSFNWTGETAPAFSGANHGFNNVTGTRRNDAFINLNFADGNVSHTSNATPDLTNSFINDTAGNAMLDLATAGLSEYDNASPVFWTVNGYLNNFTNRSGKDGWLLNTKFRTNQNISIKFNVSENVTQPTVTVAGNAATLVGTTNTTSNLGLGQVQYEYYYVVQGSETEGAVTLLIRASDLTGKASMSNTDTNTSQNLTVDYKVTRVPRLTLVDQPQDTGAGLKLNWTAISDDDFFKYSFHCNLTNSSNLADLTAVSTSGTVTDSSFTVKSYHDGTNTTLTDGTSYYCVINVSDSIGNVNTSMNVTSIPYAEGNVSLTANKWQMIGTPKYLNNTLLGATGFSTSDSVKYYNGTDATWYTLGVSTDRMYQLKGYWIYNYNGLQVNTTYRAATGGVTPETTTLYTGWNLIGSPTNTAGTNVTTKLNNALGSTKWSIVYFWNVSDTTWYYNTPTGEGDLGVFNVDGGYWISMTSAGNSTVYTGEP